MTFVSRKIGPVAMLLAFSVTCGADALPWLKVSGRDIVTGQGSVVSMRGINVGSWHMMETWITSLCPEPEEYVASLAAETGVGAELRAAVARTGKFDDDVMRFDEYMASVTKNLAEFADAEKVEAFRRLLAEEPPVLDAVMLDRLLRNRFGAAGAEEVWRAHHDTWIRREDLRRAREVGFNFVRIPFWHRWFEADDHPGQYSPLGFELLDKAVAMAKEEGLYVLLDMHGVPGGQNFWEHCGEMGRGEFFKNEAFQQRAYALWQAIARHFQDEPAVFGYDCLNEPARARGREDWTRVHDGIYRAVRDADARHIIIMEDGYHAEDAPDGFFPVPSEHGWQNIVFSFHFYETGPAERHAAQCEKIVQLAETIRNRCNVPVYIGEFNTINDAADSVAAMGRYCSAFNGHGLHWSPWTLKYAGKKGTLWGVFQYGGTWQTPNLYRDTKESILQQIGLYDAENFQPHGAYVEVLKRSLAEPVTPAPTPGSGPAEGVEISAVEPVGRIVIGADHPDLAGNKYGFEGGCALRLGNDCHLFVAEMADDPFWVTMRLGHWKSPDLATWHRVGTLFASKGRGFEADPKFSIWSPMVVFNEEEDRWNLFYVCYRGPLGPDDGTHMNGQIYRAVSKAPGRDGIDGPYEDAGVLMKPGAESMEWEGQQAVDSFYPYRVGNSWYSNYGGHHYKPVGPWLVGLATAPSLAGPWRRLPDHSPLPLEKDFIENPIMTHVGPYHAAIYDSGTIGPNFQYVEDPNNIGYSWSRDGINWTPGKRAAIHAGNGGNWASDIRTPLCLIPADNGEHAVLYTAKDRTRQFWNVGLCRVRATAGP